jgi:hypothetical protein
MVEKDKTGAKAGEGRSFVKGLSLNDFGASCANPSVVDVKNGKIVRISPLHYGKLC